MNSNEVLRIVDIFEQANIPVWLDGGWGVDALIKVQTREHSDLDVVVSLNDMGKIVELLKGEEYKITENELPTRFVMKDKSHEIDFIRSPSMTKEEEIKSSKAEKCTDMTLKVLQEKG